MRHNWSIGNTIDTCTQCGLQRRTVAVARLDKRESFWPTPRHEYLINNQWVRQITGNDPNNTRICKPQKKVNNE